MPTIENDWEARYDAETLVRSEEIKLDPKRYEKAKRQLSVLESEKTKELNAIKKVGSGKNQKQVSNSRFINPGGFPVNVNSIKLSK